MRMMDIDDKLFVSGAHRGAAVRARLLRFTGSTTVAAGVMLAAALVAIVIANTPANEPFRSFWETPLSFVIGSFSLDLTLETFVNDLLMAVFFLVVGLEIKYEVAVGELTEARKALLPIIAAVGGVVVPIIIYLAFNGGSASAGGWGIPTATDIAFALGILSILGQRIPAGLKVFLSTLAIVDDIIAIVVIAFFYGHAPDVFWLAMMAFSFGALVLLNRLHVYRIRWYVLLGVVLWFCVYQSGIHATIAGVLLALTIPARSPLHPGEFGSWTRGKLDQAHEGFDEGRPVLSQDGYIGHIDDIARLANYLTPPLSTLRKKLEPFSSFIILPLFALANAGVRLVGVDPLQMVTSPAVLGVLLGLVVGKPIGIMLASTIVVRSGLSELPTGVTWRYMLGASVLGGVGFTMSILVAGLAFDDSLLALEAKAAILVASLIAGVAGFIILLHEARREVV